MPAQIIEVITLTADIFLFLFVGYYMFSLWKRERALRDRETRVDTNYHQIVDDALTKERKIIDDATHEADQIVTGANYIRSGSQQSVDQALQRVVTELQKDSQSTAHLYLQGYTATLQQITDSSVTDFQTVVKGLETDLKQQIQAFHTSLLPTMEKELEEYKKLRMQQTDELVARVVQKASQEILNKSLSLEDHHSIMVQALERAKKEGVFN